MDSIKVGIYTLNFENGKLIELYQNGVKTGLCGSLWEISSHNVLIKNNTCDFSSKQDGDRAYLTWLCTDFSVKASAYCENGLLYLSADVSGDIPIDSFTFPLFEGISDFSKSEDSYLLVPYQSGFVVKDPIKSLINTPNPQTFWAGRGDGTGWYENDYPASLNFQFCLFGNNERAFYFAQYDTQSYFKTIGLYSYGKSAFDYKLINYPENAGATHSYAMPYPFVFTQTHNIASGIALYRAFAKTMKSCEKGTLRKRGVNERLKEIDIVAINHSDLEFGQNFSAFEESALLLRDMAEGKLMLHWYGWNKQRHDVNYPEYIDRSIFESHSPVLFEQNKRFSDEGILKIPYVNARLWDKRGVHWDENNVDAYAIRDKNGNLLDEPWNVQYADLYPICPCTKFWQSKVADFCELYYRKFSFDGLYIDQVGSFNATLCFNKSHGHPIGGGKWWCEGYHKMINDVRERVGKDAVLTTESCCEAYIDVFDMMLTLDFNFQELCKFLGSPENQNSIPLFKMIYGEYGVTYGSHLSFNMPIEKYRFNMVRNVIWGILPTVALDRPDVLRDSSKAEHVKVLRQCVDFYKAHRDIFLYGYIDELLSIESPPHLVTFTCCGKDYDVTAPSLFAAVWSFEGKRYAFGYNFADLVQEATVFGKSFTADAHAFFCAEL